MSTTVSLNNVVLCEYGSGSSSSRTVGINNSRVVGKVNWTYKDKKASFQFVCNQREVASYYQSGKGYVFSGSQAGYVRLGVNSSYTGYKFVVKQSTGGSLTGYGYAGWVSWPGTYDRTDTKTISLATVSSVSLDVGFKSGTATSSTFTLTPSKSTMVYTSPSVEYYRSGAKVYARVSCVTHRSSTTYSDTYSYSAKITVNGVSQTVNLTIPSSVTTATNTSAWVEVSSTANTVNATVAISSSNGGAYSGSQTITMSVPAMTTISGSATGTLGSNYTINFTRYDSSFSDTVTYLINGTTIGTIASGITGSTSSYTWSAPPISLASYATTSSTIPITIRCTTSSGGTTIGYTDMTVTFGIPSSVAPTLGTITLTKVNSNTTVNGWDIYLQGYTRCKIDVAGSAGIYGSTLSGYTVKVGSVTVSGSGSSGNANWTGTSSAIAVSGNVTVSVTVTDSRGRSATSTQTILVYGYSFPTATNITCHRTDTPTGSAEATDGTYIYMLATMNYSTAGGNNTSTMTIKYKQSDGGNYSTPEIVTSGVGATYGNGNISVAHPYTVVLTVLDALGNGNNYTFSLSTGMAAIHVREGGTGICFGGYATHDDSVEIGPDMGFIMGSGMFGTTLPATAVEGQLFFLKTSYDITAYVYTGNAWYNPKLAQYPIGAIYVSTNSTSPETLFGGQWSRLEDRFLLAAGSTYSAGSSGGEATHKLTSAESGQKALTNVGSHHHAVKFRRMQSNTYVTEGGAWPLGGETYSSTTNSLDESISISGSDATNAHNNMPPYLTVYMWKRTA